MNCDDIQQLLASVAGLRIEAAELSEQLQFSRMLLRDLMAMRRDILAYRKESLQRMREIQGRVAADQRGNTLRLYPRN